MEFVYIGILLIFAVVIVASYVYNKNNSDGEEVFGFEYLRKTERDQLFGTKILCIGNSYGDDSVKYIPQIMFSYGKKNVVVANLYIGGCSLENHAKNAKEDAKAYEYRKFVDGEWSNKEKTSLKEGVLDEEWDVIVFQQQSKNTGIWQTYQPFLSELITYVRNLTDARFAFNMTWAYPTGSKSENFAYYDNNNAKMYKSITSVVGTKIESDFNFDFIIPTGSAVQNASDKIYLFRDDIHLNEKGRFLASLTWVKELYDVNLDELTYCPNEVSNEEADVFISAVNNAYYHPYVKTKIK